MGEELSLGGAHGFPLVAAREGLHDLTDYAAAPKPAGAGPVGIGDRVVLAGGGLRAWSGFGSSAQGGTRSGGLALYR